MSSGFVSGGTADAPIARDEAWLSAQREIEANIQKKAIEARRQTDGKSLYETLEANKAAKQDAFEEANRLKNQFRALDQDEVEFLDSVLESTRAEEARVKKETAEGLALFRQQQDEADRKARTGDEPTAQLRIGSQVAEGAWIAGGRKRKRVKDKDGLKGVKIRRSSTSDNHAQTQEPGVLTKTREVKEPNAAKVDTVSSAATRGDVSDATSEHHGEGTKLSKVTALVSYGSDDDDDD
ncbi:hypothetical protein GLAREA_11826 [Glarea lozoyensis ATCC 20868]|uniref:FAM192A/Fyv6 N-terminal domain-containing protein n=1 Tax=Glarea lozoyensis (strain ATCC 20868 / MF5171) TaxID=1116229 RepID=S3CHA6_GLAL2|nr:uncharacterized protein GLAREA_11826 [Glarea lozoyensis ATCC 20868]EPE25245.1 hypothetical protein GLAREA_11826 [Glarea lozoyensis ATCC 20868]